MYPYSLASSSSSIAFSRSVTRSVRLFSLFSCSVRRSLKPELSRQENKVAMARPTITHVKNFFITVVFFGYYLRVMSLRTPSH